MPERIQRQRTRGWKMPDGALYIGRPTKYGNPYKVGKTMTLDDAQLWYYLLKAIPGDDGFSIRQAAVTILDPQIAVDAYRWWFIEQPHLMASLNELHGRDLVCWCQTGRPCHGDFLLEVAND